MRKYAYNIDTTQLMINGVDHDYHYEVFENNVPIGDIYVSELDHDRAVPIWNGSSPYLNVIAPQIGAYIEEIDL